MNVSRRSAHPQETITAINWPPLCRTERHSGFDPAQGALDRNFDSLTRKGLSISLHVGGYAFVLFKLAGFAPFRIVLQPFVSKKKLLSSSEDEFLTAINASQYLVLILVHCGPPTPCPPCRVGIHGNQKLERSLLLLKSGGECRGNQLEILPEGLYDLLISARCITSAYPF